eukprot:Gb_10970 [translate_table: standard]
MQEMMPVESVECPLIVVVLNANFLVMTVLQFGVHVIIVSISIVMLNGLMQTVPIHFVLYVVNLG